MSLMDRLKAKFKKKPPAEPPKVEYVPPPPQVVVIENEPPPPPHVYVHLRLYGLFREIHLNAPATPWIKIEGVSMEEAAQRLPGRGFDWNTLPKAWIDGLELSPQSITLPWDQVKAFIQG